MKRRTMMLTVMGLGLGLTFAADGTAGFRGDGTGRFPDVEVVEDLALAEHLIWRTPTPQWSNASPIIVGDRLFICAEPDILLCLDKQTGAILWQQANGYVDLAPEAEQADVRDKMQQAADLQRESNRLSGQLRQLNRQARDNPEDADLKPQIEALQAEANLVAARLQPLQAYVLPATHNANGYSSATPVSDGERVFVFFGTGVAAAYTLDGVRVWARVVEKPTAGWGHSASPVLAGGHFIIHVRDVHALDAATGETRWTARSRPRWGASVVTEIDGAPVVATANGELIRASDGEILASGLHGLEYCAPLVHDNVIYYIEHGGKAFKLPATADGTTQAELLWRTEPPKDRYYASPLYHEGLLYCVNQKGVYSVIDAATGEVLKSETLGDLRRTVYPSVTLAGSRVLLGSEGGTFVLLEPGVEMTQVAAGNLGQFRTSPVFEHQRAYIRTLDGLSCIGQ